MKKISIVIVCLLVILGLCGCNRLIKVKKDKDKLNCSILDDVKTKYGAYLITNDGSIYKTGNFSDHTNCKKIDSSLKFDRVIEPYVMDNQNNLYEIDEKDRIKKEKDTYATPIVEFVNNNSIIKYSSWFSFYLKNDGIIYNAQTNEIFKSFANEKILDFDWDDKGILWIKTDKAYYIRKVKNPKCYKYDDIKCKYDYEKDEILTKKYQHIAYIGRCIFEEVEKPNYYGCEYVLKDGTSFSYKDV